MLIEAADPRIGLMAIVQVGMAEVSTCQWTVTKGSTVSKGDGIGMVSPPSSSSCSLRLTLRTSFILEAQPIAWSSGKVCS